MSQVDYFLKIEGVDGESTDDKHKNEIDVESWSWGETQSGSFGTGTGGGTGKVSMQDFHFVMKVNKASPRLMIACATGEHFPKAILTCRKAGGEQVEYMKITMEKVMVSSYQTGGSSGGEVMPVDQISLNFGKIQFEYKPQDEKGKVGSPVTVGYDVEARKKV